MRKIFFKDLVPNDDYSASNINSLCEDIPDFYISEFSEDNRFMIYSEYHDMDSDAWCVKFAANIEIPQKESNSHGLFKCKFYTWHPIEEHYGPSVKEAVRKVLIDLNTPDRLREYEEAYQKALLVEHPTTTQH